jgi:ABC-type uncharacterized transport system permease subunit
MLELPIVELIIFAAAILIYLAAAIVGVFQLQADGVKYRRLPLPLVSVAVFLLVVMLILRGIVLKALPLTRLFESLIVLTVVFSVVYVFMSTAIKQIWFGSVMVWVILLLVLMAGVVARPVSQPHSIAATPWAMAHAIAMTLGAVAITFAAVSAFLYLLGRSRLKNKKINQVLGKLPNIEKLARMNVIALEVSFILITFGMVSGTGMAAINSAAIGINLFRWMVDSKIILVTAVWLLLGIILLLRNLAAPKSKTIAYITVTAFILILFAMVGTSVFCRTKQCFLPNQT